MDHLSEEVTKAAGFDTLPAAIAYARSRGFTIGSERDALQRIQRVAAAEKANPEIVSTSLSPQQHAH